MRLKGTSRVFMRTVAREGRRRRCVLLDMTAVEWDTVDLIGELTVNKG